MIRSVVNHSQAGRLQEQQRENTQNLPKCCKYFFTMQSNCISVILHCALAAHLLLLVNAYPTHVDREQNPLSAAFGPVKRSSIYRQGGNTEVGEARRKRCHTGGCEEDGAMGRSGGPDDSRGHPGGGDGGVGGGMGGGGSVCQCTCSSAGATGSMNRKKRCMDGGCDDDGGMGGGGPGDSRGPPGGGGGGGGGGVCQCTCTSAGATGGRQIWKG